MGGRAGTFHCAWGAHRRTTGSKSLMEKRVVGEKESYTVPGEAMCVSRPP